MNRFVLKVGRVVNALFKRTYWFNEVLFPDCTKFWNHKTFNLDVVNLGSTSGVHAFYYKDVPFKCANWALGHNPLSGDEAILKNYFSYLNPHKSTVIVPLCPFSALAGSYECTDDKYYTLLYSSSIPSFSKRKQEQAMHMMNRPLKYYPVYELFAWPGRVISSMFKNNRPLNDEQMENDAQKWISGWLKEFSIKSLSFEEPLSLINKDAIQDAKNHLGRIIVFCQERNITPVFVVPPVYYTLSNKFSNKAKEILLDDVIKSVTGMGALFINHMEDEDFINNAGLFINSFYLNEKGAIAFTNKLLKEINLI